MEICKQFEFSIWKVEFKYYISKVTFLAVEFQNFNAELFMCISIYIRQKLYKLSNQASLTLPLNPYFV